ncbi:hypothetical protein [Streptomyces bohaiensis]|uniref:Uncharacterized protein n=1 Tax=Streptomyces bohaiensis TaxID=1431344 RepID=A0ABX1C4I8_9ACTN|nr:hypothetical protein [Streptomyces bohaiensis]NJQ14131.1 hypothetical protein [Streptomyces bohaiensis]
MSVDLGCEKCAPGDELGERRCLSCPVVVTRLRRACRADLGRVVREWAIGETFLMLHQQITLFVGSGNAW